MKALIQTILEKTEKSYQSFVLTIIGALLGLIAWGGNNMYTDQKDYNKARDIELRNINKNQIIFEYRIQNLEENHPKQVQ